MKATISTPSNFWISPRALTITLNALGNHDYVQAAVLSGTVVMAFIDGIIDYDNAHNYRRWPIVAFPTVFRDQLEKFMYVRIPNDRKVDDTDAMIVYSSVRLSVYGEEVDESGEVVGELITAPSYFYIYLAKISSAQDGPRRFVEKLYDQGKLSTDEYIKEEAGGEWKKLFSFDELTHMINVHFPFLSAAIRTLKLGVNEKVVNDVKRSVDNDTDVPISDKNVVTSLYTKENFLSKKHKDSAREEITFNKGLQLGREFMPGLAGKGGRIDGEGRGEMRSLRLWESLEVPELRYNRVSVYIGIRMDTFGGGIIESVTPDEVHDGLGSATLKLENGEFGAVEEGDLVMGIWHDNAGGNAEATEDDHVGNFSFAGFKTVYMQITGVSGSRNEQITYMLRGEAEGGNGVHPFPQMHFAGRGNIIGGKTARQTFTYSTTEYSVSLVNVKTWEFRPDHYYEIHGNLEGFSMPATNSKGETYMKTFHGYGQVFGNAYLFGDIDPFVRQGYSCDIVQSTNGLMTPADIDVVTVYVRNGYGEDVTERFKIMSLTRNTGDAATDADWNNGFKAKYPDEIPNPFELGWEDLGFDLNRQDRFLATFFLVAVERETGELADGYFDFN